MLRFIISCHPHFSPKALSSINTTKKNKFYIKNVIFFSRISQKYNLFSQFSCVFFYSFAVWWWRRWFDSLSHNMYMHVKLFVLCQNMQHVIISNAARHETLEKRNIRSPLAFILILVEFSFCLPPSILIHLSIPPNIKFSCTFLRNEEKKEAITFIITKGLCLNEKKNSMKWKQQQHHFYYNFLFHFFL